MDLRKEAKKDFDDHSIFKSSFYWHTWKKAYDIGAVKAVKNFAKIHNINKKNVDNFLNNI